MQKTTITLGLCLAFGIPAQAETGSPQSGLSRLCLKKEEACAYYYGDGKLAFITNWDSLSVGEEFDRIDLSKGNALIPARNDYKKYGYINIKGQWVIQPQFNWAANFANGLAAVEKERSITGNSYAYINPQGQTIIPTGQYYNVHEFADNGLATAQIREGDDVVFIDKQGNIMTTVRDSRGAKVFGNNGLVPLEAEDKNCRKKLWGYADTSGNFVIPPQFANAEAFASNGLAVAQPFDTNNCRKDIYASSSIKGYIDSRGQWVIPPQYEEAFAFLDNGLAAVKYNGKWGMIDRQGNWVLAPTITNGASRNIGVFSTNGLLTGYIGDDDYASFNSKGEKIAFIEKICNGEVAVIKNRAGQILLPHGKSQKQICKNAKASQSPSRSESSSSDSGLVNASIVFDADTGWYLDTVSLEIPQGTIINGGIGKGETRWSFQVARATNSPAGKYSYSYVLKSYNGSNYKSCSGSFNVKESGGGYVNIKANSNCNIFVYQN